jgi:rare lipoprotein A
VPALPDADDARMLHRARLLVCLGCLLVACASARAAGSSAPAGELGVGLASYYGEGFHGRTTASGERFDRHALTAAHRTLRFGSCVEVDNLENGRSVRVVVNDRGPYAGKRIIDVSEQAARQLGMLERGVVKVRLRACPARKP